MDIKSEKFIVTYTCGDTYNIPTYKIIECPLSELQENLDKDYDLRNSWRDRKHVQIYKIGAEL